MLLAGIPSWVTSLQDGAQRKANARAQVLFLFLFFGSEGPLC